MSSSIPLAIEEKLLWQGRPNYRRKRLVTVSAVLLFAIVFFLILSPQGSIIIFLILLFINVHALTTYAGVHYYITDRRIVKLQRLMLRRIKEIPLESLSDIRTKVYKKKGYVVFSRFEGVPLIFGSLGDDPEKVKQIAEDARSQLLSSRKL